MSRSFTVYGFLLLADKNEFIYISLLIEIKSGALLSLNEINLIATEHPVEMHLALKTCP